MAGLLIIGAGGHGKVVADTAYESAHWDKIAFLDDRYPEIESVLLCPVLGKTQQASEFLYEYSDLVVAIGNNALRFKLINNFSKMGFSLPVIIHPTAFVSKSATIKAGSVVFSQAAVNAGTEIGIGSIVNTGATIDHDCMIGNGVHISPGAHLAGAVRLGNYSWIGIGAAIIHGVCIGENVTVGAGAAVIGNIEGNVTAVGVPSRVVKKYGISGR